MDKPISKLTLLSWGGTGCFYSIAPLGSDTIEAACRHGLRNYVSNHWRIYFVQDLGRDGVRALGLFWLGPNKYRNPPQKYRNL